MRMNDTVSNEGMGIVYNLVMGGCKIVTTGRKKRGRLKPCMNSLRPAPRDEGRG